MNRHAAKTGSAEGFALPRLAGTIAVGFAAVAVMLSLIAPGSTVEIRGGQSLFFCMVWLLAAVTLAIAAAARRSQARFQAGRDRSVSVSVFAVAASLCIACVAAATCLAGPAANLRAAINAAWVWGAIAAAVWCFREIAVRSSKNLSQLTWLWVLGVWVLALHGCHQRLITAPADIERFQRDPDAVLRMAGIDAAPGSAARMLFASRLFDAAPTASFALTNSLACVLVAAGSLAARPLIRRACRGGPAAWAVAVAILLPMCICLLWTKSRAAYLAAAAATAVLLAAEFRSASIPRRMKAIIIAGAAAAVAFGLLGIFLWDRLIFEEAARSLMFRGVYWQTSFAILLDHPLGIGPGNFQQYYTQYMPADAAEAIADPHNVWLDVAVTGGWAAAASLLVAAAALLWNTVRHELADGPVTLETEAIDAAAGSGTAWSIAAAVLAALTLMWLSPAVMGRTWDYSVNELYTLLAAAAAGLFFYLTRATPEDWGFQRVDFLAAGVAAAVTLTFSGEAMTPGLGTMLALLAGGLAVGNRRAVPTANLADPDSRTMN